MNRNRLPDTELEIMQIIWEGDGVVSTAFIMKELDGKKKWTITTVLSFLSRLAERGFLSVSKNGKANIYTALISEDEYLKIESKSFLERLHRNSIKSLVAALYKGDTISKEDLEELKRYVEEEVDLE